MSSPPSQIGIIILENQPLSNITKTSAPYITSLMQKYLNFTNYHGTSNPSLPDYCALSSGSWLGKAGTDSGTNGFAGTHSNIMHAVEVSGRKWKTYEEDVDAVSYGYTGWGSTAGSYGSRHCPGVFYTNTNSKPAANVTDHGRFPFRNTSAKTTIPGGLIADINAKSLPDFFIISPNQYNQGHGGTSASTLSNADKWLAGLNPQNNTPKFPGLDALIAAMRADGVVLVTFDNPGGAGAVTDPILAVVCGQGVAQATNGANHSHLTMLWGIQQQWSISKFADSDEIAAYTALTASQAFPWPQGGGGGGDTTPPSPPSSVTATALSSSSIKTVWSGATDNVAVTSYQLFRNGSQTQSLTAVADPNSFTDTGLTANTSYSYFVKAVDGAGNVSVPSGTVSATTGSGSDTTPPSTPTGVTAASASATSLNVHWTASTDNVAVAGYVVYKQTSSGGGLWFTNPSYTGVAWGADEDHTHGETSTGRQMVLTHYHPAAFNPDSTAGPFGSQQITEVNDLLAGTGTSPFSHPIAPVLHILGIRSSDASFPSGGLADIANWTPGDNSYVDQQVAKWVTRLGSLTGPVLVRMWHEMNDGGNAYSTNTNAGNTTANYVKAWKNVVTYLRAQLPNKIYFIWCQGGHLANPSFASAWFPGDAYIDWIGTDSYANSSNNCPSINNIQTIFDGMTSASSKPIFVCELGYDQGCASRVTNINNTLPKFKANPRVKACIYWDSGIHQINDTPTGSLQAFKNWVNDPYMNPTLGGGGGVTYAAIGTVSAPGTAFVDTGLTTGQGYTYAVTAFDAAGNTSGTSAASSGTPTSGGDQTPPSIPQNLTAGAATSTTIPLTWNASTDNVAVTGYNVLRNAIKVQTQAGTAFTDTALTPNTPYTYTVTAFDAAGNVSDPSAALTVTTRASTGGGKIAFHGSGSVAEGGTAAAAVPPATTQSGDTMLAAVTVVGAGTVVAPTGWTNVGGTVHDGTNILIAAYTKAAGTAETAAYTFSAAGASSVQACITSATPWALNTSAGTATSSAANTSPIASVGGVNVDDEVIVIGAANTGPRPYPGKGTGVLFGIMPNPADWSTEADHGSNAGLATLDGLAGRTIPQAHSMVPWDTSSTAGNAQFSKAGNPPATCYTNGRIFYSSWPRPRDAGSDVNSGETSNQWVGVFGSGDPTAGFQAIAAGTYDSIIDGNANEYKAWGHPFILRLWWEMEAGGVSFDAGKASTANTTGGSASPYAVAFRAAWQRVVTRTRNICGNQVLFHWNRDNFQSSAVTADQLDPGAAYVDLYGCEGYIHCTGTWDSLMKSASGGHAFTPIYQEYSNVAPLANGEGGPQFQNGGCATEGDSACANRITSYNTFLPAYPQWRVFTWWNGLGSNGDSRIDHLGTASKTAFKTWLGTTYMRPRLDKTWVATVGAPWTTSYERRYTIYPKGDTTAAATCFGAGQQGQALWHMTATAAGSVTPPNLPLFGWGRSATLTLVATGGSGGGGGGGGTGNANQGYVQRNGAGSSVTNDGTVTATITNAVAAGNHAIVTLANGPYPGGSAAGWGTVTDNGGTPLTWNRDANPAIADKGLSVWSAYAPNGLAAGKVVTAVLGGAVTSARKMIAVDEMKGAATAAWTEQSTLNFSTSGAQLTSGTSSPTTQANELVWTAFVVNTASGTVTDSDWDPGANYTQAGATLNVGNQSPFETLWTEYQVVSVQSQYGGSAVTTLGASPYMGVSVLYKAATPGSGDTTAPAPPTSVTASSPSSSSVQVVWSGATDNVAVTSYQLYRGGVQVATPSASPYTDTGLTANTAYSYYLKAVDAAGNVSVPSGTVSQTTQQAPGTFMGTIGKQSGTVGTGTQTIPLTGTVGVGDFIFVGACITGTPHSWTSVTDTQSNTWTIGTALWGTNGITGTYATTIATHPLGTTDTINAVLDSSASRTTALAARYIGVASASPDIVATGTASTTGLTVTGGTTHFANELLIGSWAYDSGNNATSTFTADSTFTVRGTVDASSGTNNKHYALQDKLVAAIGAYSVAGTTQFNSPTAATLATFQIGAGTTDTTPPTAPTSIFAQAPGQTSIVVSWSGATDNVGVTGYQILRGGTVIASPTASPYTDTGLTPGTTYTYTVRAVDGSGNVSGDSPSASATTKITIAGNLTAYVDHGAWTVNCKICNDAAHLDPGTLFWTSPTCGTSWGLVYPSTQTADQIARAVAMRDRSLQNWDNTQSVTSLLAQDKLLGVKNGPDDATSAEVFT